MIDEFIFDLKVARKKSGLTQADCGHLMGSSHHVISQIERGQRMPTIDEICALSLLFGKSFESLYAASLKRARRVLATNLGTIPDAPRDWSRVDAREQTLGRLAQRLEAEISAYDT